MVDVVCHNVGDEVLIETANRLQDHVRAGDILCRWGGEELLVVLPDTELGSALAVAIARRVSNPALAPRAQYQPFRSEFKLSPKALP